ncbi:MAG: helix-turn-helix domain-containing protein [Pseudomonadota bacterium]
MKNRKNNSSKIKKNSKSKLKNKGQVKKTIKSGVPKNNNQTNDQIKKAKELSPFELCIKKHSLRTLIKAKLNLSYEKLNCDQMNELYEIVLSQMEPPLLEMVLEKSNKNQVKAAEVLGINRNTLRKKILKYKIKI